MKKTGDRIDMRRTVLICFLYTLAFAPLTPQLFASGLYMGRIMTVHPYGAQDASRNPALLSRQQCDNAIGIMAGYETLASGSMNVMVGQPAVQKPDVDGSNKGGGRISYVRKFSRYAFGIDIYGNYTTSKITLKSLAQPAAMITVMGTGTILEKNLQSIVNTSASLTIDSSHSIGINLNCIYTANTQTEKSKAVKPSPPAVYFVDTNENTIERIYSSPGIGYHFRIFDSEIGVILSAGNFLWKKETSKGLAYDISPILQEVTFKAKGELPYTFAYTAAPGITVGAFTRPAHGFGIALELEMSIPLNYKESFLMRLDDKLPLIGAFRYFNSRSLGIHNDVTARPSISVRGGFEIGISNDTIFSIGGGMMYNATMAEMKQPYLDPLTTSFIHNYAFVAYGMAGFDIHIGKYNVLTLGSTVTYSKLSHEETFKQKILTLGKELHDINMKINSINIDITAALSAGF